MPALHLDCGVSLLEVNEGVVLQLLDALQFAELREGALQQLLGDRRGQLTHKQHLHLPDIIRSRQSFVRAAAAAHSDTH